MDEMFLYPQALGRQLSSEMTAGILARTPEVPRDLGELLQAGEEKAPIHIRCYELQINALISGLSFPFTQPGQWHSPSAGDSPKPLPGFAMGYLCPENARFKAATAIWVLCSSFPSPALLSPWLYTQTPKISSQQLHNPPLSCSAFLAWLI